MQENVGRFECISKYKYTRYITKLYKNIEERRADNQDIIIMPIPDIEYMRIYWNLNVTQQPLEGINLIN